MISSTGNREAFVWLTLPGENEPVVCGRVTADAAGPDAVHNFVYGQSYRARTNAMPLLPHDLSISNRAQPSRRGLHGVLRDAAPDAWGRRVFHYRLQLAVNRVDGVVTELDYPLAMGAGTGALAFGVSPDEPPVVVKPSASMTDLIQAAAALERGDSMTPELADALLHGTSVGGARPKALVKDSDDQPGIAKFSSTTDHYPVVKLEALGLELARRASIRTVRSSLISVIGRDVLVVRRFDRNPTRHMFSALTALDLADAMEARYASYPALADYLRKYATDASTSCEELFRRMVFNILVGNTDDHARNHALFWDGHGVALTPAYDIVVIPRVGQEAGQAMTVGSDGTESTVRNALSECGRFGLTLEKARVIAEAMQAAIREHWTEACDACGLDGQWSQRLLGTTVLSAAALRDD